MAECKDGGLSESQERLKEAVIQYDGQLKKHPDITRPPTITDIMIETLAIQLQSHKLICPHCNKPATTILWGCCKRRFAGGI